MKCISCDTEINPKWKHAIDINVCPFCGKHIMEEHLKNLLSTLAQAMEQLEQYPEQVNDWLLSNYNYIKTDSPDLKNYLPKEALKEMRKELDDAEFQEKKKSVVKIKTIDEDGKVVEQDVVVEKMSTDDRTQTFHDRANNMLKAEKAVDGEPKSVTERTRDLKAMAEKIKKDAAIQTHSEGGVAPMISKEMLSNADPEAVAAFEAEISGGIVSSAIPDALGDEDATTDRILQANLRAASKKGGQNSEEKDMKTLREMQNKVANAQKRLGTGGFSRT